MRIRLAAVCVILAALALAVLSVVYGVTGEPQTDVAISGGVGSEVVWVLPGGPSWRAGVRAGQVVVEFTSGTDPRTWSVVTSDGSRTFAGSYVAYESLLRESVPASLGSAAVAFGALLVVRRLQLAAAAALISLAISGQVAMLSGHELTSSVAATAALIAPAAWLLLFVARGRLRTIVPAVLVIIAGAWLAARIMSSSFFDAVEIARFTGVAGGLALVAIALAQWTQWRARLVALESERAADIVALGAIVALVIVVTAATEVPLLLLIAAGSALLLLYPAVRRRLAAAINDLLLAEVRGRARLSAVEEERGRIARDIHDEPLQEIAAAIRELDTRADTERATTILRSAAGHLRRLSTELRPPVVDDLGLRAAIAHVADDVRGRAPHVEVRAVVRPTDPFAKRPPPEVELAVFRIAQEAVENALKHSNAESISVEASVEDGHVVVTVQDDGTGVDAAAARAAARAGHIGLATMSQRASLIGASFAVTRRMPRGTLVRIEWRAGE